MNVILDTNVVISAMFYGGIPESILVACVDHAIQLVISPSILQEYRAVAERMGERMPSDYKTTLEWIVAHSKVVADTELGESVTEDPDDEKFIAAALESKAMIICSGDKHLLKVDGYRGIEILKPKPFADKYLKQK